MKKNNLIQYILIPHHNLFLLFFIFPLSILIGNFAININLLIISLTFLFYLITKQIDNIFQNKVFILLVLFLISLIINVIFSYDPLLSLPRVIKVGLIIFFIFSFRCCLLNLDNNHMQKLYTTWSIIFAFVTFDLIFEFFNGKNIMGLVSIMPGFRLGSFTGEESVIGNYFSGFVLIFLSCFYKTFYNKRYLNLLISLFLIIISFVIGERANFLKTFIIITLFYFFIYDFKIKTKFFFFVTAFSLLLIVLNSNSYYKYRYYEQIKSNFKGGGIYTYLDNSVYGAHYNVASEIFKDNPFFGVGIKNFRNQSVKNKYQNLPHRFNQLRSSTHPHQVHYEFLSETGLFGYLSFLLFIFLSLYWSIKNYFINKNIYQFSSILFVLVSLLPIIPGGSFFSTFTSSIFWLNYAIMVGYNDLKS